MIVPAVQILSFIYGTAAAFLLFGRMVVVVAVSNNGRCPSSAEDIDVQANRCLDNYRAFEDRYQLTGSHLFTSVDVEIIRTLCSDLKASMRCLKSLRDRCSFVAAASTQHQQQQQQQQHGSQIDAAIRPYISVVELCDHQHLYEEYAMNQNCLHGQRDMSEQCYRTFRSQTERSSTNTEHFHLQQYCGHLTQLTTCVRLNFALSCGETAAAMLVEQLVKAAVEGSHRCRNGSNNYTHEATVSPHKSGRMGSPLRRSNSAQTLHQNFLFSQWSQPGLSLALSLSLSALIVNTFGK